jgi:hypothetical protein
MNVLGKYRNGNYNVTIYDDGTKVRENNLDFFEPAFPESIDLKICNRCDMGCPMCHEDSTPDGAFADILHLPFLDSLSPYTELAIGGGNPLTHPDLVEWLTVLQQKHIIPSMTVNQVHFMSNLTFLKRLSDAHLIYGLGVSWNSALSDEQAAQCVAALKEFPNAVIHVIHGMVTMQDLERLSNAGLKILILGFKNFRRGNFYYADNFNEVKARQQELYDALPALATSQAFQCICFDNLAVTQLGVRRLLPEEEWVSFYMGDDGTHTMYIDAVDGEYAISSTTALRHHMTDDIQEMFQNVRREARERHHTT